MAVSLSISNSIPFSSSSSPSLTRRKFNHPNTSLRNPRRPILLLSLKPNTNAITNAIKEDPNNSVSQQQQEEKTFEEDGISEIGAEIKKAMEREEESKANFWSSVSEEIGQIEWAAFGKVVSTTGVVLGVITGSSVVLLTSPSTAAF